VVKSVPIKRRNVEIQSTILEYQKVYPNTFIHKQPKSLEMCIIHKIQFSSEFDYFTLNPTSAVSLETQGSVRVTPVEDSKMSGDIEIRPSSLTSGCEL
jgi:hypothetical protein